MRRINRVCCFFAVLAAVLCGATTAFADTLTLPAGLEEIGAEAFMGDTRVETVVAPDGLTKIGERAFADSALREITLPASVTSIAEDAFAGSCLVALNAPEGSYAYEWGVERKLIYDDRNASPLEDFQITNGVITAYLGAGGDVVIPSKDGEGTPITGIGGSAFRNCGGLVSVTIPNSVTSIGSSAFYGCGGLVGVTIPNSVTSIGGSAFYNCGRLTSINIPNSVTEIRDNTFYNCSSLVSIGMPDSLSYLGNRLFYGCSALQSIHIPEGTPSIGYDAFNGCSSLTSVSIPDSVTSLGYGVFSGCSSLASVRIPERVTSLGNSAFSNCNRLVNINIPEGVSSLERNLFYGCSNLTNIVIPSGVITIGDSAFCRCVSLISVDIPEGVTSIGLSAFSGCSSLVSVHIPNTVTSIGNFAFSDCVALTSVTLPNSVSSLGNFVFERCSSLTDASLPNGISSIGEMLFYRCENLASISIPNSVTEIGREAFYGCESMTSATIPNSVSSIGDSAFGSCVKLTTICGVPGTAAETFANSYGRDFVPISAQPILINAVPEQRIVYLGVGQSFEPKLVFSDGNFYSHIPLLSAVSGSAVETGTNTITGREIGNSIVRYNLIGLNPPDGYAYNYEASPVFVARVIYELPYETLELGKGEMLNLTPAIPNDGSGHNFEDITWSSSDESVVWVGQGGITGRLYALEKGEAVVTLRHAETGAATSMKVVVGDAPTAIHFTEESPLEVGVGENRLLSVAFPEGQSWHRPVYRSSAPEVAAVSDAGLLTAKSEGTAVITATAGGTRGTLTVVVKPAPTKLEFEKESVELLWGLQDTVPKLIVTPANAVAEITYTCSGNGAIYLSGGDGSRTVTANQRERKPYTVTATVTATAHNGVSATLTVNIPYEASWDTLLGLPSRVQTMENKLTQELNTFNASLQKGVDAFEETKKTEFLNALGQYFQYTESIATSGPGYGTLLPKDVYDHLMNLVYQDMRQKNTTLSNCKNENDLTKAIMNVILNGKASYSFEAGGVGYTYTSETIGGTNMGAGMNWGTIQRRTDGTKYPMIIVYTNSIKLDAFLSDLKALADTKIKDAVKSAISDGAKAMGLEEAYQYMQTLAEEENSDFMRIILAGVGKGSDKVKDQLADLAVNTRPKAKTLKDCWEDLKDYCNDVLVWTDTDKVMASDLEGVLKRVKMERFQEYVEHVDAGIGALQETLR